MNWRHTTALILALTLVACERIEYTEDEQPQVKPTAVVPVTQELGSRPSVWTDPETGCQYLVFMGGYNGDSPAVTPRMQWHEYSFETRQICGQ